MFRTILISSALALTPIAALAQSATSSNDPLMAVDPITDPTRLKTIQCPTAGTDGQITVASNDDDVERRNRVAMMIAEACASAGTDGKITGATN